MKINYKIIESIVNNEVKWFFENSDYSDWEENRWFSWREKFEEVSDWEFESGKIYDLYRDGGINEIDEVYSDWELICNEDEFEVYGYEDGWVVKMK